MAQGLPPYFESGLNFGVSKTGFIVKLINLLGFSEGIRGFYDFFLKHFYISIESACFKRYKIFRTISGLNQR